MKMKRKINIRVNRVVSALLTLTLVLCLTACGREDVERNRDKIEKVLPDSVSVNDVADMLESGMSVDEVIDNVKEIKDGKVPATAKPAEEETSPTVKPTIESTVTPEPHVHDFKVESSTEATCATAGEKKLVCECGERKVESVPASGNHNWEPVYQTITHPSMGHVEEVKVQVGVSEGRTEYECANCGARFDSPEEKVEHCIATGDRNHATCGTIAWDYPGTPIYEIQNLWVVDVPETTTEELVGYKCSICGATK